jgi:hypothetical protein
MWPAFVAKSAEAVSVEIYADGSRTGAAYGFLKSVGAIAGIAMSRFEGSAARVLNSVWDPDVTIDRNAGLRKGI